MKAILMSVQPKWCEKIASKKKSTEVRTTYPKDFLREHFTFEPFKVYIYCTQGRDVLTVSQYPDKSVFLWDKSDVDRYNADMVRNGKVMGEFICDKITPYGYDEHIGFPTPAYEGDPSFCDCGEGYWITGEELEKTQLTYEELCAYGKKKTLYGWHISDLVIYDKPKELSDFEYYNVRVVMEEGFPMPTRKIEKAPQSWVYVREEVSNLLT